MSDGLRTTPPSGSYSDSEARNEIATGTVRGDTDSRDPSLFGAQSSQPPPSRLPLHVEDCAKCRRHWYSDGPSLLHAFASVGIEHGKSTAEMADSYFARYHKNGHRG